MSDEPPIPPLNVPRTMARALLNTHPTRERIGRPVVRPDYDDWEPPASAWWFAAWQDFRARWFRSRRGA